MLTDTHCHPYDLVSISPEAMQNLSSRKVLAASSACTYKEFLFCEELAHNVPSDSLRLFPCFGIHPQFLKIRNDELGITGDSTAAVDDELSLLEDLASAGRIFAAGECGFDLFNAAFRETEKQQDDVFTLQIEITLKYDLPVVLHVRRAMHKIFALTNILSGCKAVVFHSWSGTLDEAQSLLRRGVNAYFSFGNVIMLNHKQAIKSCALLPAERLLTETDAPYQPGKGEKYSHWKDLPLILNTAADLRTQAGNKIDTEELELQIETNFRNIFKVVPEH
ncbi:MAG: TatD family hydrolase [Treponema sp.]|nr:TatD family hydrolase [Treponema sp.]